MVAAMVTGATQCGVAAVSEAAVESKSDAANEAAVKSKCDVDVAAVLACQRPANAPALALETL